MQEAIELAMALGLLAVVIFALLLCGFMLLVGAVFAAMMGSVPRRSETMGPASPQAMLGGRRGDGLKGRAA